MGSLGFHLFSPSIAAPTYLLAGRLLRTGKEVRKKYPTKSRIRTQDLHSLASLHLLQLIRYHFLSKIKHLRFSKKVDGKRLLSEFWKNKIF